MASNSITADRSTLVGRFTLILQIEKNIVTKASYETYLHNPVTVGKLQCRSPTPGRKQPRILRAIRPDQPEAAIKHPLKRVHCGFPSFGAIARAILLGTFPTFTRLTSCRIFTSMMEMSSLSVLLMQAYLPSGVKTIQFGPEPVGTHPVTFLALMS